MLAMGLGTAGKIHEIDKQSIVNAVVELGYRHIDTVSL